MNFLQEGISYPFVKSNARDLGISHPASNEIFCPTSLGVCIDKDCESSDELKLPIRSWHSVRFIIADFEFA